MHIEQSAYALIVNNDRQRNLSCYVLTRTQILADLQRKYDMPRLHETCSIFISKIKLSGLNFARWHILASKYDFKEAADHCRKFLASGVFDTIHK